MAVFGGNMGPVWDGTHFDLLPMVLAFLLFKITNKLQAR